MSILTIPPRDIETKIVAAPKIIIAISNHITLAAGELKYSKTSGGVIFLPVKASLSLTRTKARHAPIDKFINWL